MKYIYKNCGSCDITAKVNFFDIAEFGRNNGLNAHGYTLQRDFLWNLEIDDVIDDLEANGVKIDGKKRLENDINTNFNFKVLLQSKGIDRDVKFKGFADISEMRYLFAEDVEIVMPFGPADSKFLVQSSDINFGYNKGIIKKGIEAVKEEAARGYGRRLTQVIENDRFNVVGGRYVLTASRDELKDLTVYDDKANVIFDGYKSLQDPESGLAVTYDEFERMYLSVFDLGTMRTDVIPDVLYLHKDGTLRSHSGDFLLKEAVSASPAFPDILFDFSLEQAI